MVFGKPLLNAVDDLNRAFGSVPAPKDVRHCNVCCVSDEEMAAHMRAGPVRSEPMNVLAPYAGSLVVGTAGSPDDARYFMPRILDALGTGDLAWPDLPLVARFLAGAATDWPPSERLAVDGFIRALWQHRLITDPTEMPRPDAESVLCTAMHLTNGGIAAFLDQWAATLDQPSAAEQLATLLRAATFDATTWRMPGPWWGGRDDLIDSWLRSDALRMAVRRCYAATPEDDNALFLMADLVWAFGIDLGA